MSGKKGITRYNSGSGNGGFGLDRLTRAQALDYLYGIDPEAEDRVSNITNQLLFTHPSGQGLSADSARIVGHKDLTEEAQDEYIREMERQIAMQNNLAQGGLVGTGRFTLRGASGMAKRGGR